MGDLATDHRHGEQGPQDLVVHPARRACAGRTAAPVTCAGRRATASRGPSPPTSSRAAPPTRSPCSPSRASPTARAPTPAPTPPARRPRPPRRRSTRPSACKGQTITFALSTPARRLQRAGQPARVRPGQEVGRPRRRRAPTTSFSAGPYMLKGSWDAGHGRHLGAQPELEPGQRPGAPGARRPDPLPGGPRHPGRRPAGHGRRRDRPRVGVARLGPARRIQQHITAVARASRSARSTRAPASSTTSLPNVRSKVVRRREGAPGPRRRDQPRRLRHRHRRRHAGRPGAARSSPKSLPGRARRPTRSAPAPAATRRRPKAAADRGRGHRAGAVHRGLPRRTRPPTRRWRPSWPGGGWPGSTRRPSPITEDYFTAISDPALRRRGRRVLVELGPGLGLGLDDPARRCSTARSTSPRSAPGRDYGYWADKALDAQMAKVNTIADRAAREKAWADIDASLMAKGAYIGLAERRALYVAGLGRAEPVGQHRRRRCRRVRRHRGGPVTGLLDGLRVERPRPAPALRARAPRRRDARRPVSRSPTTWRAATTCTCSPAPSARRARSSRPSSRTSRAPRVTRSPRTAARSCAARWTCSA